MKYSALNPIGIPDPLDVIGLNPRVADLNGKTIGLYCTFKAHWVLILKELEKQLSAVYPDAKFTYFQYTKDLNSHTQVAEVMKAPEVRPDFEKWIAGTDVVIETAEVPVVECSGDLEEVNMHFYNEGLSYGFPIIPPTQELVNKMFGGTDLPADHVVARMPPMNGNATVEKIAVNAVMAGCLPTYMPVLIAAVEAMVDSHMWFEPYTTSVANWASMMIVNGPVRNDIGLNYGLGTLSPYIKTTATIGHTMGFIIRNIAGIKHGLKIWAFSDMRNVSASVLVKMKKSAHGNRSMYITISIKKTVQ